ncbi:hypothetical protein GOP47_0020377 [Adiantum capillus-veneris]|uniref:Pentatricopeptide repeat-containing protein n=1 Tax=Adiantum capillus-veneris TaxID=13818 RepID=A0A9D4UDI6_ADICA|nr:hypothetical protein GOP47_0020377 [Adiantum capillus-veneris]
MDVETEKKAAPPEIILLSLKSCAQQADLRRGRRLHCIILKWGLLARHVALGNSLINLYAKLGRLAMAQRVFDELLVLDVVSWTTLISGYTKHGFNKQAFRCFDKMQLDGPPPNAVTLSCLLKACGNTGELERGQDVHADIVTKGLLTESFMLGGALLNMYVKCGALTQAQQVFEDLPSHNVITWTTLITGYCEHEQGNQALDCLRRMKGEGLSPNAVTFACILKACAGMGAVDKGTEIHADIVRTGFLETDSVLGNAVLDMYCRCRALEKARQVFNELIVWDVVSWNVLITGYTQSGYGEKALFCFERMKNEGFFPTTVTFSIVLQACGSIGAGEKGREVHSEIDRQGLLNNGNGLENALIDMYAKCGELTKARQVFDELLNRDVISWNILVAGYCQHDQGEEALECYGGMQHEGLFPDIVTFICVVKACSSIGALEKGIEIHVEVVRKGLLGSDSPLRNALVDMYAKSGSLVKAQEVFDELGTRNLVAWTSLIAGFCEHGHCEEALGRFEQMEREGIRPDVVTLACVLKACGSIEAAEKGQMYYETLSANYGIVPTVEHLTCMVELFGRAGKFDKAIALMKQVQVSCSLPSWFSLWSACRKRGNMSLARFTFEYASW